MKSIAEPVTKQMLLEFIDRRQFRRPSAPPPHNGLMPPPPKKPRA